MTVNLEIILAGITFSMHGFTDRRLTLSHGHDIVIRKSNYVCPRTLCVSCDKTPQILPRDLVMKLQNPNSVAELKITVE